MNAIESYNEGVNVCHFKHEELKGEKVKQLPKPPQLELRVNYAVGEEEMASLSSEESANSSCGKKA